MDIEILLSYSCSFIRLTNCHFLNSTGLKSIFFIYIIKVSYHIFNSFKVLILFFWQFITFGFACTPLYFVWEKFIGIHYTKSVFKRALARLPVVIPIWFLAIIFPFFGPINSTVGSLLVSFTVYIIPSLAHMVTFSSASAREVRSHLKNLSIHSHYAVHFYSL